MPIANRNMSARTLPALALLLAAAAGPLAAQTSLQPKLALRPLTRNDIATYKLPATTQVSPGMTTIAVGAPLYLEVQVNSEFPAADITGVNFVLTVKPGASKAALADSPLGKEVPVFEPSDRLVAQVAGRSLLRPDVPGEYVVSAAITTAAGATSTVAQTFIAATYMGISACQRCHSGGLAQDKATTWATTGHASWLKQGIEGTLSDHYGSGCLPCHTVGFDTHPAAVNGGFDDVMAKLKWVFPAVLKAGNWEAMPGELQNLGNIQCENCHGPGSMHASNGGALVAITANMASGTCGQCHDAPPSHSKSAEWYNSKHAVNTRYPTGAGHEACVGCHSGPGFVGRMKNAKTVDATYTPINCQTCHEPHGETTPQNNKHLVRVAAVNLADGTQVEDAGLGALCMNCHQSRQKAATYTETAAGSRTFGPHHGPQADMLVGTNAVTYGQDIPSSAHGDVVEDTCVTCHMQAVARTEPGFLKVGGHTFKPGFDDGTTSIDLVGACRKCHGASITSFEVRLMDYDGDGRIEGVQTEIKHLLDQLSALLPPVGQVKAELNTDETWTRAQLKGAYNWRFVKEDGSFGIHNTAYAVGVLKASIADLKQK